MKKPIPFEGWFQPKSYLHFDERLTKHNFDFVKTLVTNPDYIKSHSFYPFIVFSKKKIKTRTHNDGTKYLDKKGTRDLCYSSHLDAQIYAWYSNQLSKKYEELLIENNITENVIAFRELKDEVTQEAKCNIHLANEAFKEIKKIGNCKVYAFDITKFFDSLEKNHLKASWCKVLDQTSLPDDHYNVFKSITSHSTVEKEKLMEIFKIPKNKKSQPTRFCSPEDFRKIVRPYTETFADGSTKKLITKKTVGIPQGSPISATLANIYMLDFDIVLNNVVKSVGGKYFRYCDDILCIIPSDIDLNIPKFIDDNLKNYSLGVNKDKTDQSVFFKSKLKVKCDKPIQYLGFIFDGENISIRPQSISRFRRRAKTRINHALKAQEKINKIKLKNGETLLPLRRKKLITKLTHHGSSNFITYGQRALKITGSKSIRSQLKKMDDFVFEKIQK